MKLKKLLALLLSAVMVLGLLPATAMADDPPAESPFIVEASALAEPIEYGSNHLISITYKSEDEGAPILYIFGDYSWKLDGQTIQNNMSSLEGTSLYCFPPSIQAGDHTLTCQVNMMLKVDLMAGGEPMPMFGPFPEITINYSVKDLPTFEDENKIISEDSCELFAPGIGIKLVQLESRVGDAYTYSVLVDESTDDDAVFDIVINGTEDGNAYKNGFNYPLISTEYYANSDKFQQKVADHTIKRSLSYDMSEAVNGILTVKLNTYSLTAHHEYTFKITKNATQFENDQITDISSEVGQFENVNRFLDIVTGRETYLVLPYGTESADVTLTLGDKFSGVQVNGGETVEAVDQKVTVTLAATKTGADNIIVPITPTGERGVEFNLVCTTQKYDSMPDSVVEYLCIGSQYTNSTGVEDYGMRPIRSLVGSNYDAGGGRVNGVGGSGPVSLGNFGGYITYYFEDAIEDKDSNPYGIDFITFGNSFDGSDEFAEPGQVWVSEDGNTWYALAGAMHYEDYADWDYQITYIRNEDGTTTWEDNRENSVNTPFQFPLSEYYPYYDFSGDSDRVTLSGITLHPDGGTNEYGNILPPFAGFGYTDSGLKATILPDEDWSNLSSEERQYRSSRNIAMNPYLGTYLRSGREYSYATDGMDLAWAVDGDGMPVSFPNGVHYVKIVTASNIDAGAIGEKSTEVNMVRVAQANDAPVGKTPAPASIYVDGADVMLADAAYTGNTYTVYNDVTVDGPFKVAVDVPEGTNVYINNNCATYANYDGMPLHKIIRVIVQDGEKEPAIYILNLKETEDAPAPSATLTLDANGGTVNGSATYSMKFDANMSGDPLPEPINSNRNVTFGGWFMGQRRFDAIPDEIQDTTLKALWIEKEKPEQDKTISVSFRLIGSTLTENGADIDLSDGDYHGAEYVTWIPTTRYTVPEDATIADLFLLATQRAGIRSVGADKGYVSTVYAPSGYELSEFTNGPRSGWMYTKNGTHTNAINVEAMKDGDVIVFHYVNDYAWEVEDWSTLGGTGWPQQSTAQKNFWNAWLKAPDSTGSSSGSLGGGSKDKTYKITVAATENGTATASASTASEGERITVTAKPAEGYELGSITVKGEKAGSVEVKDGAFTMPADDVTVTVKFKEKKAETKAKQTFTDVKPEDWFYEGVEYVAEKGWMQGPGGGVFQPNETTTRAMVAQVIWNMAGKPTGNAAIPFSDVAEGAWYADAVRWAAEKGIVTGWTDENGRQVFDPEGEVTREQFAAMLYRYAKTLGKGFQGLWSFRLDFPDAGDVSDWATEAMSWMVMNGVINGMDGKLNPQGNSTRAQVATMIRRLADVMEK